MNRPFYTKRYLSYHHYMYRALRGIFQHFPIPHQLFRQRKIQLKPSILFDVCLAYIHRRSRATAEVLDDGHLPTGQGGAEEQRSPRARAIPKCFPHAHGRHPYSGDTPAPRVHLLQVHQAAPGQGQPGGQVLRSP